MICEDGLIATYHNAILNTQYRYFQLISRKSNDSHSSELSDKELNLLVLFQYNFLSAIATHSFVQTLLYIAFFIHKRTHFSSLFKLPTKIVSCLKLFFLLYKYLNFIDKTFHLRIFIQFWPQINLLAPFTPFEINASSSLFYFLD